MYGLDCRAKCLGLGCKFVFVLSLYLFSNSCLDLLLVLLKMKTAQEMFTCVAAEISRVWYRHQTFSRSKTAIVCDHTEVSL